MKFIFLVEGVTEDIGVPQFINGWLNTQFATGSRVGVQTVRYDGWSELYDNVEKKTAEYLCEPKYEGDVIAVVSLLDLYGPTFYPPDKVTTADRYTWGKGHFEGRVRKYFKDRGIKADVDGKYRHYFAVHESEAWLVTNPQLFPQPIAAALAKQKPPEQINFKTPPAKLLDALYEKHLKRVYKKTTNARNLFPRLDPTAAAGRCPYLETMLGELRTLAIQAGATPVNPDGGGA